MSIKNNAGFATRAIHTGYDETGSQGALVPPVYMTSTFAFENTDSGSEMFAGEKAGHFYTRISNPTLAILEERIAALEGAEAGVATASGMGAITSVFWTLLKAGDEVIVDKTLYGCTFAFMRSGLTKFGIKITHVDMTDPENVRAAMSDKTRVVYFETIANPNMRMTDVEAISAIAHEKKDCVVVVDNTYPTPYLMRPISMGADIVVHSATKYLGGHGDLVAGLIVGTAEQMLAVRLEGLKDMTGSVMSPMDAMLIMRGMKTLEIRMDRHSASAMEMAQMLEKHPVVSKVWYPGLKSFPQYELACKQLDQFSGMIAIELEGGFEAGRQMMDALQMIKRAVSLGDAETLVQHPASMTHATYTPEERLEYGISEGLVRLSVGLESPQDIMADLMQALDSLAMSNARQAAE
ncbi:MAG: methionine gamma-lyase [Cohaesibacteraceae bacterium]|nr:methionine gamma-lyase [Cohaesibacteraceae bacterium]